MHANLIRCLPIGILLLCGLVNAQMRDQGAHVIEPAAAPARPPQHDPASAFASAYRDAGYPKVALLWNRTLTDRTHSTLKQERVVRERSGTRNSATEEATAGPSGSMSVREGTASTDTTKSETSYAVSEGDAARKVRLSESDVTQLQRAFVNELNRAGLKFVDRALAMRAVAGNRYRGGGDPQLIETDALLEKADLLLEVLLIEDREAPLRLAIDVRAKSLSTHEEIGSIYSQGHPEVRVLQGAWAPGASGYEFRVPPPEAPPSAGAVGTAMARDVMDAMTHAWKGHSKSRKGLRR